LTVRESLDLYAGYFRAPRPTEDVIALIGLEGKADERASRLSGGQQRRLDVGMALIGDPELLFLDEPTTGFDPSARRQAWDVIAGLRDLGKTVFLTTHYMDEAQRLADRVTIIAAGRIVARGTPADLGHREEGETTIRYRADGREVAVQTTTPTQALHELTAAALARGEELKDLEVTRPSLEDVYLELTGEAERDADGDTAAATEAAE
jgi:ABC-2 type transport system ATP-binding protein